jgi:hypothetical protein
MKASQAQTEMIRALQEHTKSQTAKNKRDKDKDTYPVTLFSNKYPAEQSI